MSHLGLLSRVTHHWLFSMALLALGVFSFRSAVADWNDVPTGSMEPSILIGDRIAVNKLAYDLHLPFTRITLASWGDPVRGDVVTFWSPADGKRLVKRVIGLPGDIIALQDGHLVVNGRHVEYQEVTTDRLRETMGNEDDGKVFFREDLAGKPHLVARDMAGGPRRDFGPVTVPAEQYLMLGDNRDHSGDSRWFGFVPRENICGRVYGVAFSLNHDRHYLPRKDRWLRRMI